MKKVVRYLGIALVVVLVAAAGVLAYVKFALPNVGKAPELKVAGTQAQIERGRYLAHHVNVCMDCHSVRDWSRFSGPPTPGTIGKGGDRFGKEFGLPGTIYARNITPAGLKDWSDGEIFRAITSGVNKEGRALFPLMPHPQYGKMDRNDVESIIAYLRTLQPVPGTVPDPELDFPVNFIVNTIPQKPDFQTRPDTTDPVALGKYLVNAASCGDCHTKSVEGKPVPGMELAGGVEIPLPNGTIRPANLTPDKETGLGKWDKASFIARFKSFDPTRGYVAHKIGKDDFQSIMPWTMYGGMDEQDLGAIYEYLRTLKPVKNRVVKFTPMASNKPAVAAK